MTRENIIRLGIASIRTGVSALRDSDVEDVVGYIFIEKGINAIEGETEKNMTANNYDQIIRDQAAKFIREHYKARESMLEELLYRTLRGETLVLVEQKTYDESLVKFQYQWQRITLPEIPLEAPSDEII